LLAVELFLLPGNYGAVALGVTPSQVYPADAALVTVMITLVTPPELISHFVLWLGLDVVLFTMPLMVPPFLNTHCTDTVQTGPEEQLAVHLAFDSWDSLSNSLIFSEDTPNVLVGPFPPLDGAEVCFRFVVTLLNTFPTVGPSNNKIAITTVPTSVRISAYSTNPCPSSLGVF